MTEVDSERANVGEVSEEIEAGFQQHEQGNLLLVLLGIALISWVVYMALTLRFDVFQRHSIFLLLIVLYCFLRYPLVKTTNREFGRTGQIVLNAIDGVLIVIAIVSNSYLVLNSEAVMRRAGVVQFPETYLALGAVLVVLEATRRTIGNVIPILAVVSIGYVFWGQHLPGIFGHAGFSMDQFVRQQYLSQRGLFSFPLQVSLKYIYLFVFFGAILEFCGGGTAFLNLAKVLVGKLKGGPAKLAVVSSGFMGMLSGSTTANVLTTGAVTIPTMKDYGYRSEFAGAIESAASTGGQLTPPVMGAAIFIMLELTGLSYLFIITHALLPALLFFLGIMAAVHFQSVKMNLPPIPDHLIPKKRDVVKDLWYFIPIIAIVFLLWMRFSVRRTILISTALLIVMTYTSDGIGLSGRARLYDPRIHHVRFNPLLDAIDATAKRAAPVIAAATAIGVIVGNIGATGLSIKVAGTVTRVGEGNLLLALILAALLCILFGVTMTSITVYILVSILVVPGLVTLGIGVFEAHMFVYYYGMLAMVTPPVCLAAYAASTIAESDPIKTGVIASIISAPAYLIPFAWVFDPALLLLAPPDKIILAVISGTIAIIALASGTMGYFYKKLATWERVLMILSAILLIHVSVLTDLLALGTIAIALRSHRDIIFRSLRGKYRDIAERRSEEL